VVAEGAAEPRQAGPEGEEMLIITPAGFDDD